MTNAITNAITNATSAWKTGRDEKRGGKSARWENLDLFICSWRVFSLRDWHRHLFDALSGMMRVLIPRADLCRFLHFRLQVAEWRSNLRKVRRKSCVPGFTNVFLSYGLRTTRKKTERFKEIFFFFFSVKNTSLLCMLYVKIGFYIEITAYCKPISMDSIMWRNCCRKIYEIEIDEISYKDLIKKQDDNTYK